MSKYIDLKGKVFGKLRADKFIGGKYGEWECTCLICENKYITRGKYLRNGTKTSCKECSKIYNIESTEVIKYDNTKPLYNMQDMQIGNVKVIEYLGNGIWKCKCSCGKEIKVKGFNLRKAIDEKRNYFCEQCSASKRLDDLSGKTFGNWYVINYVGDGYYKCECQCDNKTIKNVYGKSLKRELSTSCGCLTAKKMIETRIKLYGDIATNNKRIRSIKEVEASGDKECLLKFIVNNFDKKPTISELANKLHLGTCMTARKIKEFNLCNYIDYNTHRSCAEKEIERYIKSIYNGDVITNVKYIINPYELDIYIPDKQLAIEFNGSYWHSDIFKEKSYHQEKTIECIKKGIRLIHIFDYEWNEAKQQEKIKNLLKQCLVCSDIVPARKTKVKEINNKKYKKFIEKYHLQGYIYSSVMIGCFYEEKLIGVMTFGKPRFKEDFQYELLRLCWKPGVSTVGGSEKLFSYFIKKYNPESIVTYSDISKFKGSVYTKLGFETNKNSITEPSYVWVNHELNVLSRYQTQKKQLIEKGLEKHGNTEYEIMSNLGYYKVYNCGNLKFTWNRRVGYNIEQ